MDEVFFKMRKVECTSFMSLLILMDFVSLIMISKHLDILLWWAVVQKSDITRLTNMSSPYTMKTQTSNLQLELCD